MDDLFSPKSPEIDTSFRSSPYLLFVEVPNQSMRYYTSRSFESTGLGSLSRLEYNSTVEGPGLAERIEEECCREKPRVVIFGALRPFPQSQLSAVFLASLRQKGIKIAFFCSDSEEPNLERARELASALDAVIILDTKDAYKKFTEGFTDKCISIPPSFDMRITKDAGLPRTVDVSFLGSVRDRDEARTRGLVALQRAGFKILFAGGTSPGEIQLPYEYYIQGLQISKITANFCYSNTGLPQRKGRVFEALACGTFLLEEENAETAALFTPYEHYVPFGDEKDLVEKTRYYLAHPEERERIARAGKEYLHAHYTARHCWQQLLEFLKI